jgi:tryptophan synthase beta chain
MQEEHEFGSYGGRHVPEELDEALERLAEAFDSHKDDGAFRERYDALMRDYAGRPTPVYHTETLSEEYGAEIYLKREDLLHGGAHKINNAIGQALLADEAGKTRLIAETGAGQHGTATAMVGALLGLDTEIYTGAKDVERQRMNVFRMRLMGATVRRGRAWRSGSFGRRRRRR